MTSTNLEIYWGATLDSLLAQLESTPNVNAQRLASFKTQLNHWRSRSEKSKGQTFDVSSAVAIYSAGRKLLEQAKQGGELPPALQIADVTVETAARVAVTTAVGVAGACLLIGLAIYGLSR